MDCVFCNIVSGKIPSNLIYQDQELVAFPDIHPQAPTHIIIIPKNHIQSLNQIADNQMHMVTNMIIVAKQLAKDSGIYQSGYRLLINTGKEGGQVVQHLHMHLIGGKQLNG